ncbi:MAG: PAS domain-containing protein [Anaerolineales bacterium]|nr:PAS domain-containing protein [Anaerolineales bacterium]
MPVTLYFTSIVLTCALTGFLASFAWRQPPLPGVRVYAWLAFSECLLALAEILSMLSGTQAQALLWFNLRYIFTAIIPVIWLAFSLTYSGQRGWLSNKLLAGALVIPAITQVMLWSNDLHGLWVKQDVGFHQDGPFWIAETSARIPGLWFMLHSMYSLILLRAGIGVIVLAAWGKGRRDRGQALLLSSGALVVLTTTLIPVFNLLPQAEFNLFIPGIGISALLYALAIFRFQFLERMPAQRGVSRISGLEVQDKRSLAVLALTFVLIASGLAAASYSAYRRVEEGFRAEVESELSGISLLKVRGLRNWRDERLADASLFYRNDDLSELVRRYLEIPGDTDAQDRLVRWLERTRVNPEYERVALHDVRGRERISSPAAQDPPTTFMADQVAATLASGQMTMLDFHRDTAGGPIHLAILVPILDQPHDRRLGVLVLHVDPYVYLYPYIEQWPVYSLSAETLLVRRDGDDVLFLNDLKYGQNTALDLRFSLENTEVLAVKAVLGQVGVAQGVDYRGVKVIGYLSAVPESPWFLVARMDTAEVYAPLRERMWETVLFFGVLLLVGALGLTLAWRQQRVDYYRRQVHATQAIRESEERYELANRATLDAIWDWNLQTGAWWRNENYQALFGYPAEEIDPGIQWWTSRIHPEDVERVETGIHAAIDSGRDSWSDHYRLRRKDGQYVEIEDRGYIGRVASGIPSRMIGAMQDVTARRRQEAELLGAQAGLQRLLAETDQARRALLSVVEDQRAAEEGIRRLNAELELRVVERTAQLQAANQELEAANERLQELDRMKTEFVSNVTHELRTPITNVMLYLDLARRSPSETKRSQYFDVLKSESVRLGTLIESVLTLSRLERGTVPMNLEPHPLDALLADVRVAHQARADAKGITLEYEPDASLPVAWVNRLQMHQVLANLVGNAVAYTPSGGRVMLGTARHEVGGKEFIGAVVNNSGTLILPEDMSRLYERFYRGDVGRQSGEPGTGLGLAISKEIVELHHGWIDVESNEQGGTTFSVWLPVGEPE